MATGNNVRDALKKLLGIGGLTPLQQAEMEIQDTIREGGHPSVEDLRKLQRLGKQTLDISGKEMPIDKYIVQVERERAELSSKVNARVDELNQGERKVYPADSRRSNETLWTDQEREGKEDTGSMTVGGKKPGGSGPNRT